MVERLVIHDGELRGAITSVRASRLEFGSAITETDALQQAVGHCGLSNALQGFESCWSVRRSKLVLTLETIEKQLQGALDTFGEWDVKNTSSAPGASGGAQQPSPAAVPAAASASGGGSALPSAPMPPAPTAPMPPEPGAPVTELPIFGSTMPVGPPEVSVLDPGDPTPSTDPELPGSPDAINALLKRLEQLADSPAGIATLAGAMGALTVLLALFPSGLSVAPGLAGVDGERVRRLIANFTGRTDDRFGDLSPALPPPVEPPTPNIEDLLDGLDPSSVIVDDLPAVDEPNDPEHAPAEAAPDSVPEDDEVRPPAPESSDLGPAPEAPAEDVAAPGGGSAPLPDSPPAPEPPPASGGDAPATSSAFDESFPEAPGSLDRELATPSTDIDAELAALAAGEPAAEQSQATARPMGTSGLPMAAAGMGSMAAASTAQAGTSGGRGGAKAVDFRDDERIAAARRELDQLRPPTKDEDKS